MIKLHNLVYDTFPIVAHCPGKKTTELWEYLIKRNSRRKPEVVDFSLDATIITWNNLDKGCLESSLDIFSVPYLVLGKDVVNWCNPIKIELTNEALRKCNTKYIIGIDSHDAMILSDPNEIIASFCRLACRLLFNCGPIHHPPVDRPFVDFQEKVGEGHIFRNLNGGAWVGETEFCKTFFADCMNARQEDSDPDNEWWDKSEQLYIKSKFQKYFPDVQLDYRSDIFQIIHPMWQDDPNIVVCSPKML